MTLSTGSLLYAGGSNYYWSSTTYPNAIYAYHIAFSSINLNISDYYTRFLGFSVRGGYVDLGNGSLVSAGLSNLYWSATTYSNTTYAYYLAFDNINVHPSSHNNRFYSFSAHQASL